MCTARTNYECCAAAIVVACCANRFSWPGDVREVSSLCMTNGLASLWVTLYVRVRVRVQTVYARYGKVL